MATPFDQTPKWFDAEYYLGSKVAQLIAAEPEANWTRDAVVKAFTEAGFSNPYDHYLAVGDTEGLNPNQYFNADQYVAAKMALLGTSYTKEMVLEAIHSMGITVAQHYEMFGYGEGLNPSQSFSNTKYFEAKAEELNRADAAGAWTADKVKAAIDGLGITPMDHYFMFGKAEGMDKYDLSENGQPIPKPGKLDIKLTTGDDVVSPTSENADFKTTDRDDVISSMVSGSSVKSTLNAKDVIDGGAGTDTLKVDMQGNFTTGFKDGGSVKNVEIIALENITGNRTFNAKGIEAAREYTMSLGGNTMNINDVDNAGTSFSLQAGKGAALNVRYQDTALTGRNDNAYVGLYNVGEDEIAGAVSLNFAAAKAGKVEGISLYSSGKSNFVNVTSQHDTVAVRGGADIDVAIAGGATAFDASMATGKVTADLTASIGTLKTIAGGFGDDTLVLTVADGVDVSMKQTISGFETLALTSTGTGNTSNITVDMTNVTGLNTLDYVGVGTDDDAIVVKGSSLSEFNVKIDDILGVGTGSLSYDGAGALNVSLYGDEGNGATLASLTAGKATTLNISNTAEDGVFEVTTIIANSATNMVIDAGAGGVTVSGGAASSFTSLQSVTVSGKGAVNFTAAANAGALNSNSITSFNAAGLDGQLTLDLSAVNPSDLTNGAEITVGNGGSLSIEGTAGNDTITLGARADKVVFAADLATNGSDFITGYLAGDKFSLVGVTKVNSSWTQTSGSLLDNKSYYVKSSGNEADSKDASLAALKGILSADSSGDAKGVFVIVDGDSSAVYSYHSADSTRANLDIQLLGTIDAVVAQADFLLS